MSTSIGQRLKAAREAAGLTQEKAAAQIGVSMMTVSRWERGQHVAEGAQLGAAARVYGRTVDWLLQGDAAVGERLERDSDRSPYPAFETYLDDAHAAERPPVSEEHARELRQARFSGEVTLGMAASLHRELIARDRGRGREATSTVPEGMRAVRPGRVKIGPSASRKTSPLPMPTPGKTPSTTTRDVDPAQHRRGRAGRAGRPRGPRRPRRAWCPWFAAEPRLARWARRPHGPGRAAANRDRDDERPLHRPASGSELRSGDAMEHRSEHEMHEAPHAQPAMQQSPSVVVPPGQRPLPVPLHPATRDTDRNRRMVARVIPP